MSVKWGAENIIAQYSILQSALALGTLDGSVSVNFPGMNLTDSFHVHLRILTALGLTFRGDIDNDNVGRRIADSNDAEVGEIHPYLSVLPDGRAGAWKRSRPSSPQCLQLGTCRWIRRLSA